MRNEPRADQSNTDWSHAELEAAAQRVALELTRGGTPGEKMARLERLPRSLQHVAHVGWDTKTAHSLFDSGARQLALAAALACVATQQPLLSVQILGAGSLFDIKQTVTTVEEWADSQVKFTAVDLMEPLPIAGVTDLADHVRFVRVDYTDLRSVDCKSTDVTVLQWALFRAEDAKPLAQQLECTTAPGGAVVVVQQDHPDAVVNLGKALNRIHGWTIVKWDLGDNTQQSAITLVATKPKGAQERAMHYIFPSIGLMKGFADVLEFKVYEQIVVVPELAVELGAWVLEASSAHVKQLEATDEPGDFYKIIGVYSGSTTQLGEKRWVQHTQRLRNKEKSHSSPLFQQAYDTEGAQLFPRWVWKQSRVGDVVDAGVSNGCAMIATEQQHIDIWDARSSLELSAS